MKFLFVSVGDTNIPVNERFIYTTVNAIDDVIAGQIRVRIYPPGTLIIPKISKVMRMRKVRIQIRYGTFDNNLINIIPDEERVH